MQYFLTVSSQWLLIMIARQLTFIIQSAARTMPVVSITGPRQSGKTTLSKGAFPDYAYANLENLQTRQYARENPIGFLQQYPNGLIIDEAQYVPELFSYIQVEVDRSGRNGQYILSGSQNFLLMEKITQSLAGRVAVFNLLPFSTEELNGTIHQLDNPFEYIVKGFYPRIYDQGTPADLFYTSYMLTYLERDVRLLKNIGDLASFERFVRLCAGHIGQIFNQTSLSNDTNFLSRPLKVGFQCWKPVLSRFCCPPIFEISTKGYSKHLNSIFTTRALLAPYWEFVPHQI